MRNFVIWYGPCGQLRSIPRLLLKIIGRWRLLVLTERLRSRREHLSMSLAKGALTNASKGTPSILLTISLSFVLKSAIPSCLSSGLRMIDKRQENGNIGDILLLIGDDKRASLSSIHSTREFFSFCSVPTLNCFPLMAPTSVAHQLCLCMCLLYVRVFMHVCKGRL